MNELRLFSGTGNPDLTRKIAERMGVNVGNMTVQRFSDGEVHVLVDESVRGDDVFIVQSMPTPVNEYLMELLIMVDAFTRASARRVNVVIPYYCYSRQDRKVKPREPVTAKLVANLITAAGTSRLLTVDLHAGQIVGFFDLPVDNLYAGPIIADYLMKNVCVGPDTVVVSPDVGGVPRARALAEVLGTPIAIIVKRRPEPNKCEVMEVIGEVAGKTAIMLDDMIDTGGSIIGGARALLDRGAKAVYAACTHGVLSGGAPERLVASPIEKVIITDTIPLPENKRDGKIEVISVADLLADAIMRIHEDRSVSEIFSKAWKGQS
ncbi:MAG: ribose-phosphate pyrophosphokinase [Armatimonadetes bacterium]|nr:ribose-phosphate pyrophosphokinase [Armatimonadota bacterium]